MKKFYLLLTCVTMISFSAMAQDEQLRPFKVDFSVGAAIPGGSGSKGGGLFVVEPKYAVMPNLALGLRMEIALVGRFDGYDQNGDPNDISLKASASYLLTADYYLRDNYALRPFVGAGAGIFTLASIESQSNGSGAVAANSKFGGVVRAGVEVKHFRFGLEYNLVPKSLLNGYDQNGDPAKVSSLNSYIGIKLGVCFGGGPIR